MPISLPPISRRRFLAGSLAGLSTAATTNLLYAAPPARDPNRFALFADTHVAGDRTAVSRGTNMTDNFIHVTREVLQCQPRPAGVLVCGDCAYNVGTAEDYTTLHELVQPLRQDGIPVHLALGNHDHRQRFLEIVEEGRPQRSPVEDRHILVIKTPLANWFLLDSLDETNKTPGVLGEQQLEWLPKELERNADKPALVMVHHNPDRRPKPSGLVETEELFGVLAAQSHVKALFYGHSHHWELGKLGGIHLINLPPVAYVFRDGEPNGWVDARIQRGGISLKMNCIDPNHPEHGKQYDLTWS
jgi:hypothetical protein